MYMHIRQKSMRCLSVVCNVGLYAFSTIHSSFKSEHLQCFTIKLFTETSTDYGEVTTNLTFSSCESVTCINVAIENNDFAEDTEVFSVRLQRANNLDSSISLILDTAIVRESVDSLCRDGADTPIVRVHWKAFLTREYSRFKPFSAREWPIRPLLYPTIPHK